eukprot:692735-Pleurochrysis_carterae.AAC.1
MAQSTGCTRKVCSTSRTKNERPWCGAPAGAHARLLPQLCAGGRRARLLSASWMGKDIACWDQRSRKVQCSYTILRQSRMRIQPEKSISHLVLHSEPPSRHEYFIQNTDLTIFMSFRICQRMPFILYRSQKTISIYA